MNALLDSAATWFLDAATQERDGAFVVHLTEGIKGDERQYVEHDGDRLGPYFPVEVQATSRCAAVRFPEARAVFSFDESFDTTDPELERGIGDGEMVRIRNDRGAFVARARVTDRAREGLVVGLSIWWKKLAPDGRNANEVTSQAVTDLGGSATFYDCLVEVERIDV